MSLVSRRNYRITALPQDRIKISAVVITLNEEEALERCLRSLQGVAEEVVVLDSFSTDNTAAVAHHLGAAFHQHLFEGYGQQKRRAIDLATHDWVLSLDADEALSPSLRESILAWKAAPDGGRTAYACNRLTYYCGRPIRHGGWYPDRLVRLWHRRHGGITPDAVHERWEARPGEKAPGFFRGDLLHYSFLDFSAHVQKIARYSEAGAQHDFARGKRASTLKILFAPAWIFLRAYFIKAGFLDGWQGYVIARASAAAAWMKYVRLRDLWRQKGIGNRE